MAKGNNLLHIAAMGGHVKVVEKLLNSRMDVNAENEIRMTPLMLATESGHKACVKVLLDHGADVSIRNKMRDTALSIAKTRGYKEIEELLEAARGKGGLFNAF